jgi:SAM-dependent methyltransferase
MNKQEPISETSNFYKGIRIQAPLETHEFVADYARKNITKGEAVLDIAAGGGALAKRMIDHGFKPSCTSWNGKCDITVPVYKLDLDKPFTANDVGGEPFRLVSAIEIIEHLENPASFLRSCHDIVAPDGVLILSTPNIESAAARLQWLMRGCPWIFDGEEITKNRHISMMWQQGLEYLIQLAGFHIKEKHLLGPYDSANSLRAKIKHLIYWLMEKILPGDIHGSTRLYVLSPIDSSPRTAGPGDVW